MWQNLRILYDVIIVETYIIVFQHLRFSAFVNDVLYNLIFRSFHQQKLNDIVSCKQPNAKLSITMHEGRRVC